MDKIIALVERNPGAALSVCLIVAVVWLARQWVKSLENERGMAAKSAAAIEAANIRLERIEGWVQPQR